MAQYPLNLCGFIKLILCAFLVSSVLGGSNLRADSWDAIAKTKSLLSYGSLESLANLTQKSEGRTNGEFSISVTLENLFNCNNSSSGRLDEKLLYS